MNTHLTILALTRFGATIEIIALLLGAGAIGFLTSWFYLKSLRKKIVHRTNHMEDYEKRTRHLKKAEDEALENIAKSRSLINYNSFGTATPAEKDDLTMISGIGPFIEERLHALEIYTFLQISRFTPNDIRSIDTAIIYFSGRIERDEWVAQAKELIHNEEKRKLLLLRISERKHKIKYERIGIAKKEDADDLTIISGIGGWIMAKLNMLDIYTFKQVSKFNKTDIHDVTEAIEYFPGRIERDEWIHQAKDLVRIAGDKVTLLRRIRERKINIQLSGLGNAYKHEANNLTLIDGLGLWVEERLNTLDIYTFEQISRLTHTDIVTITEVLELIPGRIEEDNWVGQAQILVKSKLYDLEMLKN